MEEKLFIARIQAENFLMISKIDYKPRPGINIFLGKNTQGKTDLLRLLKATFRGCGIEYISHGKDKTTILVRLNNGLEIKRAITEKSKRFQILTPEGDYKASPQVFLDELVESDLSFDPIAFALKTPKEQKQMLMEIFNIGRIEPELLKDIISEEVIKRLDFSKDGLAVLKDAEIVYYSKRGDLNKEVNHKKAIYDEITSKITDFNPEEYSDKSEELREQIIEKEKELSDARAIKRQAEGTKAIVDRFEGKIKMAKQEFHAISQAEIESIPLYESIVADLKSQIMELQKKLKEMEGVLGDAKTKNKRREDLLKEIENHKSTIETLPSIENIPDIEAIEKDIITLKHELSKNLLETSQYKLFQESQVIKSEYDTLHKESQEFTAIINKLRDELPLEITKDMNIPFASLSFDGDVPVINGNRIDLMSTKEQMFVGLDIYLQQNQKAKLKIILVDRIESLDDESYEAFWEWAFNYGVQVFAARVLPAKIPDEVVMMENGEIK